MPHIEETIQEFTHALAAFPELQEDHNEEIQEWLRTLTKI